MHQLGYTGPIIAQANGGMYPFPNDYMDFQVYRTMPRPFAEIYNERMRQREALKPGDNGNDTSHENHSDTTVMMVTNVLIGNASIGYSNNIEAHPIIKEAKKDQLFERLAAHGTPSPGIDPKSLKPVLSFQDKGLPFPVPKPVEHMDEHPDVNFIVDNRMSQDKMPSANDQLPVDPDIIAVFGVDFEADEALKQQSLSNDEDQENMSLIEFAKGDNPSKGTIQTQQHTIQANTSSPNPDNGTAAPKPLAQVDPNTLNADIQPSGNAETHKVNGSEHVGGNNARIGAAIKRPNSAASSAHGFEFELHFEVLEGRLEKPKEDNPLLEACFEANGMVPAAFDLDVVDSTGFIKTRRIGIHEDSKEKVGAVCDEVVHFATGYTHLVIHELKETPAYDEYGDDTDDSDYEFHPDNYSPEDFDEFFGEEAQDISDALYTEAREMDLEAEEEEKKRMMKKAMAKKKKKRSRKGKGKAIYYDSDDDSNSDSDSDIDTPPPVKKARAPRKKAAPRKKRTEGVLAINNSRGNQAITVRDDPTLVKIDKAKVAARLREGMGSSLQCKTILTMHR